MSVWSVSQDERQIIDALKNESDRAVAIIGHCIIEGRLEKTLKAHLRGDRKIEERLFGVTRPLAGFAAKNDLAYLLRCYGHRLYKELEVVNAIRNKFAHYFTDNGAEVRDFKSEKIAALCARLTLIENYILPRLRWDEIAKLPISVRPKGLMSVEPESARQALLANNRERFISTIGLFTVHLGVYPQASDYIQLIGDEPQPSLSRRLE